MIDAGTLLFLLCQTCDVEPTGSWQGPDHYSYTTAIRRRGWLPRDLRRAWSFTVSHRSTDRIPEDGDWTVIVLGDRDVAGGLTMNEQDLINLARLVHGLP